MGYQIEQTSKQTNHRRLQAQEKFIGEVIDEFLRVRGTDAAEEKRGGRCGREQHVTLELPPGLLQKLPELQERLQHMHAHQPPLAGPPAQRYTCTADAGTGASWRTPPSCKRSKQGSVSMSDPKQQQATETIEIRRCSHAAIARSAGQHGITPMTRALTQHLVCSAA